MRHEAEGARSGAVEVPEIEAATQRRTITSAWVPSQSLDSRGHLVRRGVPRVRPGVEVLGRVARHDT